jgi:hypothetical protein
MENIRLESTVIFSDTKIKGTDLSVPFIYRALNRFALEPESGLWLEA